jgi:hypothetical protein
MTGRREVSLTNPHLPNRRSPSAAVLAKATSNRAGSRFPCSRMRSLSFCLRQACTLGCEALPTGFVTSHPLLGSRTALTSQVGAANIDGRWLRTLTRFYRLGGAIKHACGPGAGSSRFRRGSLT